MLQKIWMLGKLLHPMGEIAAMELLDKMKTAKPAMRAWCFSAGQTRLAGRRCAQQHADACLRPRAAGAALLQASTRGCRLALGPGLAPSIALLA
ncbi:hypothetical protein [Xanthomonas maliensis]|uniref:hypothetical protein n=1 Tax=Xanthomonas maliensis TaxID=1321368 RepID=UPI0003B6F400|nr:hypothetical protein [Xanthomonas maliensis]KAB7766811.1 hypothetical protein CKY51_12655 [Xanthomonas maliensis]